MLSSQGRIQTHLLKDVFRFSFTEKTLKNLRKYQDILKKFSLDEVIAGDQERVLSHFSLEDFSNQFEMIEEVLEIEYTQKNNDQLKVALEYYKLAIMETMLHSVCENEEALPDQKPSSFRYGIYYFLFIGGTWIAYLHGYDAAKAITDLLPCQTPHSIVWGSGSILFLIALGLFSAFEAEELSKHMGFQSIKNLETTLDITQRQIEVTHDFMKHLCIHSENKNIKSPKRYTMYAQIAEKFDDSITKTKNRVSIFSEGPGRKIVKSALVLFGMAFSAADEVFLAIGFGALALSGPWGWIILGTTALIGAILFYAAFHNMIRNKVAPTLRQKDEILEKYKSYEKDHLLEGIQNRLEVKKYIKTLEKKLEEKERKIYQLESEVLLKERVIDEKNNELAQFKKIPSKEVVIPLQKFSHFKSAPIPVIHTIPNVVKAQA